MKRHLDLQNKIAVETTGTGLDVETALTMIETKINGMTREQIKEVSLALDTAKQRGVFVGDSVKMQPACAQLLWPIARIFGPPVLAYLIGKAGMDTYEIFKNRADVQTPPLLFSKKHKEDKKSKEDKESSKPSEADKEREKNKAKGIPESALGSSGKPKIHTTDHPSKKRAGDGASDRGERGKAPEHHVNPVEGDPHFHPSGSNSREHHAYPMRGSKYHPPKNRN